MPCVSVTCKDHINHTPPFPYVEAAKCNVDLCPLGSTRDESVLHSPLSIIRWHHQHAASVNFSLGSQGLRHRRCLKKSREISSSKLQDPKQGNESVQCLPARSPSSVPPGLPALSVSVDMPFTSALQGNICGGHQCKIGNWNGTVSLIKCPWGPKAQPEPNAMKCVYSDSIHVAETHQRSRTYPSHPAKRDALITNHPF